MNILNEIAELGFDNVCEKYDLTVANHDSLPLVILNYSKMDKNKYNPVAKECRALVLQKDNNHECKVVARAFNRFFNVGECLAEESKFDYRNFVAERKEDGSLILLWYYEGQWHISTKGSFGNGNINGGAYTWKKLFWEIFDKERLSLLDNRLTYVFELCSPYNQVVLKYEKPTLFLLSSFYKNGCEFYHLDKLASDLGVLRPEKFYFTNLDAVKDFLENEKELSEGFVLVDRNGLRLKLKTKKYLELHYLHNNGNLFRADKVAELILNGEIDEALAYFPALCKLYIEVMEELGRLRYHLEAVWKLAKNRPTQKDFAIYINKVCKLPSILFNVKKMDSPIEKVMAENYNVVVDYIKRNVEGD